MRTTPVPHGKLLSVIRRRRGSRAFSLVEIVCVVGIVMVLAFLAVGIFGRFHGVGDRAAAVANLRALYIAFDAYTQAEGHWPQNPFNALEEPEKFAGWWIREMGQFDVSPKTWQDPGVSRLAHIQGDAPSSGIHYWPTPFDAEPRTPYKWPNMPWLIQMANVHPRGSLMIFPDGSVRDMESVISSAR